MPKVKENYISNKKDTIIECAHLVFQEKPLFQITMRDIIKKTGFSQGGIYRYYSNVNEIFLDAINQTTIENQIDLTIGKLIDSDLSPAQIIYECIIAIGRYIEKLQKTLGGKMLFSLLVMYAFDSEKKKSVVHKLIFHQSLNKAQQIIIVYIKEVIDKGLCKPIVPIEVIIRFTQSVIDGIANDAAIHSMESPAETYVAEQFEMLTKTLIHFLGLK